MQRPRTVAIAGGHGQIALRLARLLAAHGDDVRGLIRDPEQSEDLRAHGSEPVVCDLETARVDEVARAIAGSDAVVFAAGAGPGSGAERKLSLDRDGAITLLEAARSAGVARYVMVSSVGAEAPPDDDDVFSVYLRAKAEADRALAGSDREWTIVRPGPLTDEPGSGRVRIESEPVRASVSRDDVAAVLAAIVHARGTAGQTLYVTGGADPIERAVAARVPS
jgi:uncharacterized protein YbjT (DUF2867 family)